MKYIKIIKYIGFYTKIHTGFTIKPVHFSEPIQKAIMAC